MVQRQKENKTLGIIYSPDEKTSTSSAGSNNIDVKSLHFYCLQQQGMYVMSEDTCTQINMTDDYLFKSDSLYLLGI